VVADPAAPTPDDVEPVAHETRDRIITGFITVAPVVCLGLVVWQAWSRTLHWNDVVVFAICYALTGLGITVGFHRLFTHRSFATRPWVRFVFAGLGSAAIEGPVISWVADHRKHHAFADQEGDPHSPHVAGAAIATRRTCWRTRPCGWWTGRSSCGRWADSASPSAWGWRSAARWGPA